MEELAARVEPAAALSSTGNELPSLRRSSNSRSSIRPWALNLGKLSANFRRLGSSRRSTKRSLPSTSLRVYPSQRSSVSLIEMNTPSPSSEWSPQGAVS